MRLSLIFRLTLCLRFSPLFGFAHAEWLSRSKRFVPFHWLALSFQLVFFARLTLFFRLTFSLWVSPLDWFALPLWLSRAD